jgi:arginine/ornithine transport system substrate-binding protein
VTSYRRLLTTLAFSAILASSANAKDWSTIRVSTEGDYPRFSYTDPTGNLKGWDIDIVNALCEVMHAKCTFTRMPFDAEIPALLAGKVDAISSISATDERKKKISFTDKHYNIPVRFVARKGSGLKITPEGLKGKTVGVQTGSIQERYADDNFGKVATIKRYQSQDAANLDLVNQRIDTTLAQVLVLQDGLLNKPQGKDFEFVGPELTDRKWFGEGIAIGVRKEDNDLRMQINKALKAIRENGTYQKINEANFPGINMYGE